MIVFSLLFFFISISHSTIHNRKSNFDTQFIYRVGMFAPGTAPSQPPGNGYSYMNLQVSVEPRGKRPPPPPKPKHILESINFNSTEKALSPKIIKFDLLYFPYEAAQEFFSLNSPKKSPICCTQELYDNNQCNGYNVGQTILPKIIPDNAFNINNTFSFSSDTQPTFILPEFKIQFTDLYYLILNSCSEDQDDSLSLLYKFEFMNPYGYLPGQSWPYLTAIGILVGSYSGLLIVYIVIMWRYESQLIKLHYIMLFALVLLLLQSILYTGLWDYLNQHGVLLETSYVIFCVFIKSVVSTYLRGIFLAICFGLGIVYPNLSRKENYVVFGLPLVYFCVLLPRDISSTLKTLSGNAESTTTQDVLLFLLVLIDTSIIFLSCFRLFQITNQLKEREQNIKYQTYYSMFKALLVSSIVILSFMVYFSSISVNSMVYDSHWREEWIRLVFLDYITFCLVAQCLYIWRPNHISKTYSSFDHLSLDSVIEMDDQGLSTIDDNHDNDSDDSDDDGFGRRRNRGRNPNNDSNEKGSSDVKAWDRANSPPVHELESSLTGDTVATIFEQGYGVDPFVEPVPPPQFSIFEEEEEESHESPQEFLSNLEANRFSS